MNVRALLSVVASVLLTIVASAIATPASAQGAGPSGNTRWAVLLCKFADVSAEPRPASYFRDLFTESGAGKGGMFDYWRDMSMGAVDLTGSQVFDWKPMPLSLQKAREDKTSRWDLVTECVNTQNPFVSYPGFYGIIAIVNEMHDAGSNGQVSLWLDGSQRTYGILNLDPGAVFGMFTAHEMGHAYGLRHSFQADKPDSCSLWGGPGEYCDQTDIMSAMNAYGFDNTTFCNTGSPADCRSGPGLSAAYRDQLGWIPSNRAVDISSVPGGTTTVTLTGLESGRSGTLLATITGTNGRRYAVEFRTRDRWDRAIPRETVQVREIVGKKAYLQKAKSGQYNFLPGDYMADYGDNVAISVLGIDSAQQTATVRLGPTPPATVSSSATLSPITNAAGWSKANTTVTLRTLASSVGVQSISFSAQGADPLPTITRSGSTTSLTFTREGTTTLVYAGLDNAGNSEFPRTLEIKIDRTQPHATAKVGGDWSGTQYIELEAVDQGPSLSGIKRIEYEAYGANPISPTTVPTNLARFSISAPGETSLFYWATDFADNIDGPYRLTFKPQPQFSPTTLQLSTPVGSTAKQTVTLKNVGATALPINSIWPIEASGASSSVFKVTANPTKPCTAPVIPQGTCLIDVSFTPTTTGTFNERLVLNGGGWSSPDFVALTGTALAVPKATLSTSSVSFGKVSVGQTSTSSVSVKNDGIGTLNISSFSGGGVFQPWGGCSSIPQGQSCTIWINFNPNSVGPTSGSVTITHNANGVPGSKSIVAVDGLGVQATVSLSPASLDFGAVDVGTTSSVLITRVTNTSLYDVEVLATAVPHIVGANAAEFDLVNQKCGRTAQLAPGATLNPGAVCELAVVFRPQSGSGPRSAALLFGFNAANPPHQVALTGVSVAPGPALFASVNPTSVDFGLVPAGDVATQVVTITNTGPADLGLKGVALPKSARKDGFRVDADDCSGVTLATGKSCDVTLSFGPPSSGIWQSVFEVYDGTGNPPQQVPLRGEEK